METTKESRHEQYTNDLNSIEAQIKKDDKLVFIKKRI